MIPSVRRLICGALALCAVLLLAGAGVAQAQGTAGAAAQKSGAVSATGAGQTQLPDLNGVWSAPFVQDISKVLGHQPPFTKYGLERWKTVQEIDDPLTQCLPIGPARGIQAGIMPFQLIQTPDVIGILFENQRTFRLIYTDGRPHPKDLDMTWFGDSIGRYEGNTLIVDTVGVTDRTWIDTIGHQHSDQLHIVERFEKVSKDLINWTVTYEDPVYFTEPWSFTLPIKRQNTVIMSYSCEENEKDRVHLRRDPPGTLNPAAVADPGTAK